MAGGGHLGSCLASLFAPQRCLACGARHPPPWCAACDAHVRVLPSGCRRCASPPGGAHACWPLDAPVDATHAYLDYRGPVVAAIRAAKLAGAHGGWDPLGRGLAGVVRQRGADVDVVTWVATLSRRVARRGVDHAMVLANVVATALELPVTRLLRAERSRASAGDRYVSVHGNRLPGSHVLLIDDVLTTGSTSWRAASVLQQAGAGRVELGVVARAGSHPLGDRHGGGF